MSNDIQTVEAVYESDAFRLLTPLLGLKEHARVLLQVWPMERANGGQAGLASLSGGWDGSDGLAIAVESVFRSRSPGRSLPLDGARSREFGLPAIASGEGGSNQIPGPTGMVHLR